MSHTQGKLRVGTKYATDIYADRAGHAIARAVNPQAMAEDEANARRLVACWNLCDGMRIEDIEGLAEIGHGVASLIVYGDDAKKQRNELLEALQSALKTAEFENHPFRAWHDQARAAINKAEGKA